MITQAPASRESIKWENTLKEAIRCPKQLFSELSLPENHILLSQIKQFGLLAPRPYVARISPEDPEDPLLRQILPLAQEEVMDPSYTFNPLQEDAFSPVPGLLHKFDSRVLLTVTGTCPVHCRYCFRRYFPYAQNVGRKHWEEWFAYCASHSQIKEVILSGGDPLSLPDRLLQELCERLSQIPSIEVIRFHTRFPIMIPERVTQALCGLFSTIRPKVIVVLHSNHPNEIDAAVIQACKQLANAEVTLLNQSVLLNKVNDQTETLCALSWKLIEAGVLPYYLHLLDKVQGSQHFFVEDKKAKLLEKAMQSQLPGYLVPRFVREVPGASSKQALSI